MTFKNNPIFKAAVLSAISVSPFLSAGNVFAQLLRGYAKNYASQ